jgi:hypothetical protein
MPYILAGFFDHRAALNLGHRLLDVGVDTAEDAREQVTAQPTSTDPCAIASAWTPPA